MPDSRHLLDVLKAELAFLESGGYRRAARYPWRPNFVFEDSPTCLGSKQTDQHPPCSECILMRFVPQDRQATQYPCRHIPLSPRGETVNSFYEWGTEEELEAALAQWLREEIRRAEQNSSDGSASA